MHEKQDFEPAMEASGPVWPSSLLRKRCHQLQRHHLCHQALSTVENVTGPWP